ncbi:unnamed protein product [Rotaria socialis]|uniref:Cupin type-2 domain-containing protein n=1 Tax=Rotaria socialis TaxID=392032 RepID=A0A818UM83_9BILA|nr:unnamed protein product [Rotaria socialis]CAF4584497.1 unnamed protein product [Rotaria socialis]
MTPASRACRVGSGPITQSDFIINQPGCGQKLHVLPYPNAYHRIVLHGNQTNNQFTIIEGLIYINEEARLHYHMNEDEMFFVINGTLQFAVDGKQFCARAGISVYISRSVTQFVRNINSKPAFVQILFAPSGREKFLETVSIINDNSPIDSTQANLLALNHGQVNLGEVSKCEDLNCVSDNGTLIKLSLYSIRFMFISIAFYRTINLNKNFKRYLIVD